MVIAICDVTLTS